MKRNITKLHSGLSEGHSGSTRDDGPTERFRTLLSPPPTPQSLCTFRCRGPRRMSFDVDPRPTLTNAPVLHLARYREFESHNRACGNTNP